MSRRAFDKISIGSVSFPVEGECIKFKANGLAIISFANRHFVSEMTDLSTRTHFSDILFLRNKFIQPLDLESGLSKGCLFF